MSRIHEALQRAESDHQFAAPTPPLQALPVVPTDAVVELHPAAAPAAPLSVEECLGRVRATTWHPDERYLVTHATGTGEPKLEEFRTLRARLYQLRGNMPLKRVVMGSALPGEGKTFVAANLAVSFVRQRGRRVLLVDADLRRPSLHYLLGTSCSPGLSDYLRGECDEFTAIQRGPIENLYFMAGGTTAEQPAELVASSRFGALLDRVTPWFDWVLIDTPAAVPMADASIVAAHADGVLLVVQAETTQRDMAQRAKECFRQRPVVGVVLNQVHDQQAYNSYTYSYAKAK